MIVNKTISPDILRNSFLFKDTETAVLEDIVKHCQRMELPAGETLFEQHTEPDAMYFLEEGQIHVVRHYPDGYEVILATEVPYYVIGELSLLANRPRTGKVVAVGDSDLIRMSRETVVELCQKFPEIAFRGLSHLGNKLYQLNLQVRESAIGNVGARVASVLLLITTNASGETHNSISVTRLARATAMDADVIEYLLNQWAGDGILSINGQQITIHQLDWLKNKAG